MAMSRRSPRRRWWGGRKRKIPLARLSRRVARKKSEWLWLYNDIGPYQESNETGCGIRCLEFGPSYCDEAPYRIEIIGPQALSAAFGDTVTVAKMRGFLNMVPRWPAQPVCEPDGLIQDITGQGWPIYCRAGLYKSNVVPSSGLDPTFINPLFGNDWTDVRSLKEWNHIWQPTGSAGYQYKPEGSFGGICPDVTKASVSVPGWTLGSGSGNWLGYTEPAISTSCAPYILDSEECYLDSTWFERHNPRWWRMSLNRNRPIDLSEDDDLSIFMNFSHPRPYQPACGEVCDMPNNGESPCSMNMVIALKILIQYG